MCCRFVRPLTPPGLLTHDIEDTAILLNVLQGVDPRDKRTTTVLDVDPMQSLRLGVKGLASAGCPPRNETGSMPMFSPPLTVSVDLLAHLGVRIMDVKLPGRSPILVR